MNTLLEAQNVTRVFGAGLLSKGQTVAVDDVSLTINDDNPSITAIAGESGSGKTTLARLLLGMIQPTCWVDPVPWPLADRDGCSLAEELPP